VECSIQVSILLLNILKRCFLFIGLKATLVSTAMPVAKFNMFCRHREDSEDQKLR